MYFQLSESIEYAEPCGIQENLMPRASVHVHSYLQRKISHLFYTATLGLCRGFVLCFNKGTYLKGLRHVVPLKSRLKGLLEGLRSF